MSCHPKNAKFIRHFESLRQDAIRHNNASLARGYAQIIASLQRYPLALTVADDAECLQGVGPVQLQIFQSVMAAHTDCAENFDDSSWKSTVERRAEEFSHQIGGLPRMSSVCGLSAPPPKKIRRAGTEKTFFPPIGGSKWAVMIILHSRDSVDGAGIVMSELHRFMENMHAKYPKTTKFGESTITQMIRDGVIERTLEANPTGRPNGIFGSKEMIAKIKLTDKGREAGNVIWSKSLQTEDLSTLLGLDEFTSGRASNRDLELVLIVDNREFAISNLLESANLLSSSHLCVELRNLSISDFLWVWRRRSRPGDEYVAGFAVERKTIEDLSTSIKDGRYEEQKLRLERAPGISRVVYIVEGSYEETAQSSLSLVSEQAIRTAIRHTEMTPGFSVIETKNIEDTTNVLIEMHARIESSGFMGSEDPNTASIDVNDLVTFRDFSSGSHKTNRLTIAQITARMLRVIPGIGAEAIGNLNEYLEKTGKGGLSMANVAEVACDLDLNTKIKETLNLKRIPFSATAQTSLREQYTTSLN